MNYRFYKTNDEAGNIDGCQFMGDYFSTTDEAKASRLRNYKGFGKTVFELDDKLVEEPAVDLPPAIEGLSPQPKPDYNSMDYETLMAIAKERKLVKGKTKREALIKLLEA